MGSNYPLFPSLQPSSDRQGGRMLLATALCFGVLLASLRFFPSRPPAAPSPVPASVLPSASSDVSAIPAPAPVEARSGKFGSSALQVEFTNDGAGIHRLTCLRNPSASLLIPAELTFTTDAVQSPPLLAVASSDLPWSRRWTLEASDNASARFSTVLAGGVTLTKTLRVPASGYLLEMDLEASNPGLQSASVDLSVLVPGIQAPAATRSRTGTLLTSLLERPNGLVEPKPGKSWPVKDPMAVRWAGSTAGYFATLAHVVGESVPAALLTAEEGRAVLALGSWTLVPGGGRKARLLCYAGPLKDTVLMAADPELPKVLERGHISTLIKAILDFLHRLTGNYGFAIILLTLLVRAAIHPLNRMSQISMMTTSEKMKRLQPRLEEIKKRHKSDARKLMSEQTRIMKEEGMTPFSPVMGCLPMLLQLPVMFALYGVLQSAIELRGAPFCLWIKDLAVPDTITAIGGFQLNPLPIALIGVTVWQMWRAPKPPDPQMAQQQKMMMFIMPVMFGFMFYKMPAGITLYWFTSTTFSIGEQAWIRRLLAAKGIRPGR